LAERYCKEDHNLNLSQADGVKVVVEKQKGVTLLVGPPGTGKTRAIVPLLSILTSLPANGAQSEGKLPRVMLCAPTNIAMRSVALRYIETFLLKRDGGEIAPQFCLRTSPPSVKAGMTLADILLVGVCNDIDADLRVDTSQSTRSLSSIVLDHRCMRLRTGYGKLINELSKLAELLQSLSGAYAKAMEIEQPDQSPAKIVSWIIAAVRSISDKIESTLCQVLFETPRRCKVLDLLEPATSAREGLSSLAALVDTLNGSDMEPDSASESGWSLTPTLQAKLRKGDASYADLSGALLNLIKIKPRDLQTALVASSRLFFATVSCAGRSIFRYIYNYLHNFAALLDVEPTHVICHLCSQAAIISAGEPGAFIDSVVIDEAAQLSEAETAIVFSNELSRLILVGDPKQLPSTVISNLSKSLLYGRSLFERLESQGHPTSMFNVQV
jgi:hypothetical protein